MFTELPVETVLLILVYLPIPSIHDIKLISRHFHFLVTANEPTIYRSAAFYHDWIPSPTTKSDNLDALDIPKAILDDVRGDWRIFCEELSSVLSI